MTQDEVQKNFTDALTQLGYAYYHQKANEMQVQTALQRIAMLEKEAQKAKEVQELLDKEKSKSE